MRSGWTDGTIRRTGRNRNVAETLRHLKFLRAVSDGKPSVEKLRGAIRELVVVYHIYRVEAELIGDIHLESGEQDITVYESGNSIPAGDPAKYAYTLSPGKSMVVYIYPAGTVFDDIERRELEIIAAECMMILRMLIRDDGRKVTRDHTEQQVTGLPNGNGYLEKVAERIAEGMKIAEQSALYFNLKGFGEINRQYGREVGNTLLRQYADAVKAFVGKDGLVGHLGEDNFVALVPKKRQAEVVAFLRDVHPTKEDPGLKIGATIGVWEIPGEVDDTEEVIKRPYIAYNQAKNFLLRPVVYASDALLKQVDQQRNVLERFESALAGEEFQVYYQPKVDSVTRMLVGAEGLVRWIHKGAVISPGVFIPALEQSGQTLPLDLYVLRHTCMDLRRCSVDGLNPVPVSVNFSRRDLKEPGLAKKICAIIEECGVRKELVEIELTESIDNEEHGVLAAFIDDLNKLGIRSAIDDFGSGYSSLSTLREFQVHTLKIDRSFVNSDDFSWRDEIILRDIVHMAQELGMNVLTEGVERDDQLAFVNSVGCHVIQGFYFDRPLPREEYEKRLVHRQYP